MQVIVLSGACYHDCRNKSTSFVPYGTNSGGQLISYRSQVNQIVGNTTFYLVLRSRNYLLKNILGLQSDRLTEGCQSDRLTEGCQSDRLTEGCQEQDE